jgi:hypothetical protein
MVHHLRGNTLCLQLCSAQNQITIPRIYHPFSLKHVCDHLHHGRLVPSPSARPTNTSYTLLPNWPRLCALSAHTRIPQITARIIGHANVSSVPFGHGKSMVFVKITALGSLTVLEGGPAGRKGHSGVLSREL